MRKFIKSLEEYADEMEKTEQRFASALPPAERGGTEPSTDAH
jgi:hypothetical protein